MSFLDKVFRWKKKPFGGASKDISDEITKKAKKTEASSTTSTSADSSFTGSGRYAHILLRPHISEKSSLLQSAGQYIFEVKPSASKGEVMKAVDDLFGIKPVSVNITRLGGKVVRFGRSGGKTKNWKKAVITLPVGKSIDIYKK